MRDRGGRRAPRSVDRRGPGASSVHDRPPRSGASARRGPRSRQRGAHGRGARPAGGSRAQRCERPPARLRSRDLGRRRGAPVSRGRSDWRIKRALWVGGAVRLRLQVHDVTIPDVVLSCAHLALGGAAPDAARASDPPSLTRATPSRPRVPLSPAPGAAARLELEIEHPRTFGLSIVERRGAWTRVPAWLAQSSRRVGSRGPARTSPRARGRSFAMARHGWSCAASKTWTSSTMAACRARSLAART